MRLNVSLRQGEGLVEAVGESQKERDMFTAGAGKKFRT